MLDERNAFIEYIKRLGVYTREVENRFDVYYEELLRANAFINLYSRKMSGGEVWLKHFLDSVSIFEVYREFGCKRVLDFGTGGGLPGVPIWIVESGSELTFLDSTQKKIRVLQGICEKLGMRGAMFLSERLESRVMEEYKGYFDIVVCRSVKVTEVLLEAMKGVLKVGGRMFLYKGKMENGEWTMENGEWKMDNGKWKMGNG